MTRSTPRLLVRLTIIGAAAATLAGCSQDRAPVAAPQARPASAVDTGPMRARASKDTARADGQTQTRSHYVVAY